jgi:uncharacterized protein (TIGR02246 family)
MTSSTPADVLARRRQLMLNGDADGFADLFAPDAVIEFAFHGPPGTPVRLEGREAIREYSRRVMASPLRVEAFEVTELYQAQDPEVVIAEMRAKATMTTVILCSAATSPIPASWKTSSGKRVREADVDPVRRVVRPRAANRLQPPLGESRL